MPLLPLSGWEKINAVVFASQPLDEGGVLSEKSKIKGIAVPQISTVI